MRLGGGAIISNEEIRARCWALTWFLKDDENLDKIKNIIIDYLSKYTGTRLAIGNVEMTENEKPHCHIMLYFKNPIQFGVLKFFFTTQHIEKVISYRSYFAYLQKEGLFYSDIQYKEKVDIYESFIEDVYCGMPLKELMKKYPRLFLFHFDNIIRIIDEINNAK